MLYYLVLLTLLINSVNAAQYDFANGKSVGATLWNWKFTDIAAECTNFLGPNGYSYVQTATIQPHNYYYNYTTNQFQPNTHTWCMNYGVLGYTIGNRLGTETEFANMVTACKNAGVDVVVDIVLNHVAPINQQSSGGWGTNQAWSTVVGSTNIPNAGFGNAQTHDSQCNYDIGDWNNLWEIQTCRLATLTDLNTEDTLVRTKQVAFLNKLIDYGVMGFRLDAAKHIPLSTWQYLLSQVHNTYKNTQPVLIHELYAFNDGYKNYQSTGLCSNFEYAAGVGSAFRNINGKTVDQIGSYLNPYNWLEGQYSSLMIENHDKERDQDGNANFALSRINNAWWYKQAQAFAILYPWGTPVVHSSYAITAGVPLANGAVCGSETPGFAPVDSNGMVLPVGTITNNVCPNGWACQHRWSDIFPLVRVRNYIGNNLKANPVIKNYGTGSNQIWFSVINKGFVAINSLQGNQQNKNMGGSMQTGLPAGTYCNMVYGRAVAGSCVLWPGVVLSNSEQVEYTVNNYGMVSVNIKDADKSRVLAIYADSDGIKSRPAQTSVTFQVTHNTGYGDNLYIVGDFQGWETCNAIPCTWNSGNVWTCPRLSTTGATYNWKPIQFGTASGTSCGNPIWYSGSNQVYTATGSSQTLYLSY